MGTRQTDKHQDTANAMLRLALIASLAAAVSAMPAADPQMVYYYPGMTAGYVQQPQVTAYVQQPQVTVQAAEPKTVSYKPRRARLAATRTVADKDDDNSQLMKKELPLRLVF